MDELIEIENKIGQVSFEEIDNLLKLVKIPEENTSEFIVKYCQILHKCLKVYRT